MRSCFIFFLSFRFGLKRRESKKKGEKKKKKLIQFKKKLDYVDKKSQRFRRESIIIGSNGPLLMPLRCVYTQVCREREKLPESIHACAIIQFSYKETARDIM